MNFSAPAGKILHKSACFQAGRQALFAKYAQTETPARRKKQRPSVREPKNLRHGGGAFVFNGNQPSSMPAEAISVF